MADQSPNAKEWDQVRVAFSTSIMVDTALTSLAQNLDTADWPIKGKEETPSVYIDLTYDEASALLALKGQPPETIDRLTSILKETLAFDDPFGDMVDQASKAEARDNPFLKNLAKLGIPESYPIALCGFTPDTQEFCRLEKLNTLGEFAVFAENMSQSVIVGGDFRRFLNALANVDEAVIAEILPFRRGTKGVHLPEAIAQATAAPDPAERVAAIAEYFDKELKELKAEVRMNGNLHRHLVILNDAAKEKAVAELITPYVGGGWTTTAKKGFFSRLFKR
jgi:hypothetical protein